MNEHPPIFEDRRVLISKRDEFVVINVKVYAVGGYLLTAAEIVGDLGGGDHPYFTNADWAFTTKAPSTYPATITRKAIEEADRALRVANDHFDICKRSYLSGDQGGAE